MRTGNYPTLPRYDLYIRRSDGNMRLVNRQTGLPTTIASAYPTAKLGGGIVVLPKGGTGVFLMREEIHAVDTFEELERSMSHTDEE